MQEVRIGSSQAAGKISRNGDRSLHVSEEDRDWTAASETQFGITVNLSRKEAVHSPSSDRGCLR